MPKREYNTQPYLRSALVKKERNIALKKAKTFLKEYKFDAVVGTGVSGVVFGSMLALVMSKDFVAVRKSSTSAHSSKRVEGLDGRFKYIIIDDLIDSGATLKNIKKEMEQHRPFAQCIGMYTYDSYNCIEEFDGTKILNKQNG